MRLRRVCGEEVEEDGGDGVEGFIWWVLGGVPKLVELRLHEIY